MKLAALSCLLLAFAIPARAEDTLSFPVATGAVKVTVLIIAPENDSGMFLPGDEVNVSLLLFNGSAETVTVLVPEAAMHVAIGGSGTSTDLRHPGRIVLAPGERRQLTVTTEIPLDADQGVRFRVGALVGLASNPDDLRAVF